jgi:hypothetical protein
MNDREIETPTRALVEEAIDAGDAARAKTLLAHMVADWERNKDYSINWIASLLSFVGRRMGEPAVEEALRDFGERYVRARRAGSEGAPARKRAEAIARGMKANGAEVAIAEDDEKIELSFRCGSGGALIDGGAYGEPRAYLTLVESGPVTFGRASLPVYCAHCSVNNEIQPIEWTGAPATVQFPPEHPGDRCIHHVYKDAVPAEIYARAGKPPPGR